MALAIETFDSRKGGQSFFKALGHPLAARQAGALLDALRSGSVALYDPHGLAQGFDALYDLSRIAVSEVFVQDVNAVGSVVLERLARPVTELRDSKADSLFVLAFDAERPIHHIRHLIPAGMQVLSLDALRIPAEMLSNRSRYLDPLNFATNFALFRDAAGQHTRLVTANYWAGYGAEHAALWLCLFDDQGRILAQWQQALPAGVGSLSLDSREIRQRFALGEFTGSLFLHAIRIAGHDIVKYALDTYGDDQHVLSCTHDANAWPAERYAGLPAPAPGEKVLLWVQNSHPCPIPAGSIGLNLMGDERVAWLEREIPPFGTYPLDVSTLLPEAVWPQQLEIRAGKHFVRPRYEVFADNGRQRIAHANVERADLASDPRIPALAPLLGKGYLLPAPVLPPQRWRSLVLPTPMATGQQELPVKVVVYDASGQELASHSFGRLARHDSVALDVSELLEAQGQRLPSGYGHMELQYDFSGGGCADGWLHGLFRYQDRLNGHSAETSFGAHVFNTVLTYNGEPQSYTGAPPGLSTRLFLRLGPVPADTLCHLIYPASTPWHERSDTQLILCDRDGTEQARRHLAIPCGGSRLWRYSELFDAEERQRAGDGAYVLIRDLSCRLFGYHGLLLGALAFSLDHMFGF
ncbi:MAG TPA: hypothetical protein VNN09_02050 [Candidatus Competibacteraceae bacterium]|nr:hypothetical protein [Candidatus Competibacteraceae bacterium]